RIGTVGKRRAQYHHRPLTVFDERFDEPDVSRCARSANRCCQRAQPRDISGVERGHQQPPVRTAHAGQRDAQPAGHPAYEVPIMRRIMATFLLWMLAAPLPQQAQQPAQQQAPPRPAAQTPATPADGAVKFQSSTQLVVETVTVTDKSGKPIEGLTAK